MFSNHVYTIIILPTLVIRIPNLEISLFCQHNSTVGGNLELRQTYTGCRMDFGSCGIKISGSIFLSLQQNLYKAPSTVIMTDIRKLNFSVSVTQSVLNFKFSVNFTECN
jgi:hypothetical protein